MTEKNQIPSYKKFRTCHSTEFTLENLSAEILFRYLFRGESTKRIEKNLFGTEEFHGNLSKSFLNFFGVDTSGGNNNSKGEGNISTTDINRGIFKEQSRIEVVKQLQSSSDDSERIVGSILAKKIPTVY